MDPTTAAVTPRPVLLIPGWKDDHTVMQPLARHLRASGWPESHVMTMSFRDPFGSNVEHAEEIAIAIDDLHARHGNGRIAVIAHSMGGLALRWFLNHHDASSVSTAVFLATPHRGTWIAMLGWGKGASEMRPSSQFLRDLQQRPRPQHVRHISFRAPYDTRLLPPASAWLDDSECLMLPAAGHKRILRQRVVFDAVVTAVKESPDGS